MKNQNSSLSGSSSYQTLPVGAFVVDQDLKILAWNYLMERFFNIPSEKAIGNAVHTLLDEHVIVEEDTLKKVFTKLLTQHRTESVEASDTCCPIIPAPIRLKQSPEDEFYLHTNLVNLTPKPQVGMNCVILGGNSFAQNQCCEQYHKRLLALSPGMAYQILNDGKWTIRYVSEGCLELTGYSQEYFQNKTFSALTRLFHPVDETDALGDFYSAIFKNASYKHEFRLIHANGKEKWVLNRGQGIFSDQQELLSVEGYMIDMSHYRMTEKRLMDERKLLRNALHDRNGFGQIIGRSPAMHLVYTRLIKAAMSDDSVFVYGETGTGKELVAYAIHENSARKNGPYIAVNCGAIPETLIEDEFFGHKKGAFTGANADKKGYLEAANGGTLFLDEIGEISLSMQVKLLRALESGGFCPIGGNTVVKPNLRVIAASNKDLQHLVQSGEMRRDFFYRIYIIPIHLPTLRNRGDDIKFLVEHFVSTLGSPNVLSKITKAEYELLMSYSWPGNVRELQNAVRRYLTMGNFDFIRDNLDKEIISKLDQEDIPGESFNLQEAVKTYEKRLITRVLEEEKWHKINAASRLGISRRTLFRKIKELELE